MVAAIGIAMTLSACGGPDAGTPTQRPSASLVVESQPDTFTAAGTLTFGRYGSPYLALTMGNRDDYCQGFESASFAFEGQEVTLKDAGGQIVALTRLGRGKILDETARVECQFSFTFEDVPPSPFYSLELGSIQEDYTVDELRRGIRLTLGY